MIRYEFLDRTVNEWETIPYDGLEWADLLTEAETEEEYDVYDEFINYGDNISDIWRDEETEHNFWYVDDDNEKHYVRVRVRG